MHTKLTFKLINLLVSNAEWRRAADTGHFGITDTLGYITSRKLKKLQEASLCRASAEDKAT